MKNFEDSNKKLKINQGSEIEERIKNAFIALHEDRPIEKISIKMITDLAGLNRGTFYIHFIDIYDLREKIEREFFELIKEKVEGALVALFQHGALMEALPDMDFYNEHKKYLQVLLCGFGKSQLGEMMKQEVKKSIQKNITLSHEEDNIFTDYALEYLTSAMLGVLIHWIKHDMQPPMESLGKFITDITDMGSVSYLLKSVSLSSQNK